MSSFGSVIARSPSFAGRLTKPHDERHPGDRDLYLDRTGFVMTMITDREELESRLVQARLHAAEPHETLAQARLNLVVSELEKQLGIPLSRLAKGLSQASEN